MTPSPTAASCRRSRTRSTAPRMRRASTRCASTAPGSTATSSAPTSTSAAAASPATFWDGVETQEITVNYTQTGFGYPVDTRCNQLEGCGANSLDTIGVAINYTHPWVTPLAEMVSLNGTGFTFTASQRHAHGAGAVMGRLRSHLAPRRGARPVAGRDGHAPAAAGADRDRHARVRLRVRPPPDPGVRHPRGCPRRCGAGPRRVGPARLCRSGRRRPAHHRRGAARADQPRLAGRS